MKKLKAPAAAFFALCAAFFLFSCAGLPSGKKGSGRLAPETPPGKNRPSSARLNPELPPVTPPERPELPAEIMGKGKVSGEKLGAFLLLNNSVIDGEFARSLAKFYIEEAAVEGVNHDIAFVQMCHETGFLRYGALVKPEWNNFCGLGAIGPNQPGEIFPDPRTGVRAHIQHLQAYASVGPLKQALVDPRYRYVKRGSSPAIDGLAGTWAADKKYGEKLAAMMKRLYDFSF
jgi:hypothetical protein